MIEHLRREFYSVSNLIVSIIGTIIICTFANFDICAFFISMDAAWLIVLIFNRDKVNVSKETNND